MEGWLVHSRLFMELHNPSHLAQNDAAQNMEGRKMRFLFLGCHCSSVVLCVFSNLRCSPSSRFRNIRHFQVIEQVLLRLTWLPPLSVFRLPTTLFSHLPTHYFFLIHHLVSLCTKNMSFSQVTPSFNKKSLVVSPWSQEGDFSTTQMELVLPEESCSRYYFQVVKPPHGFLDYLGSFSLLSEFHPP